MAPLGVLLANVGSPSAPTPAAVRRYLGQFLGDPKVVQLPRWLWLPLLHGLILPRRSPKSAALYQKIWSEAGSPLIAHSRALAAGLQQALGPEHRVELGMRYGEPSLASAIDALRSADAREILLLPLFPQYSETTSGTVIEEVRRLLGPRSTVRLRLQRAFFDDPTYLAALAARVRATVVDEQVDHYLFSYHGIPLRYVEAGDPYRAHCQRSAELLAKALGLARERWSLAYQSRFGREPWLQPYAAERIPELAREHPRLAVVCPAFTTDCLETLEEVGLGLASAFREAGGQSFRLVPCLNADPAWIEALAGMVRRRTRGMGGGGARGSGPSAG